MHSIYFARHGETVWNVENKICGMTDSPLTEKGRQQARELGRKVKESGVHIDEILYSPLSRAADTAKAVAEAAGLPARCEPRLREQCFGKYEGTPRDGAEFRISKTHFADRYDGGESMSWPSAFIICWTSCGRMRTRPIFSWPTMASPVWSSPISTT